MSGSGNHTALIADATIQQYERDGAVCVRQALGGETVARVLEQIDALAASDEDRWTTSREGGFSDRHLWPTMAWMREVCMHSRLPEIAGRLMRSTQVRLFFDHTFCRDAGTRHKTPWHQDRPYWPFQGKQIASVWVALTPCDANSSGLQVVRSSHSWGKVFRPEAFGKTSGSAQFLGGNEGGESMPDFDARAQEFDFLSWEMAPGDAIVFGAEVVHGATRNDDISQRRAALSVRYVGDDARWDPRPGTDPIVTREQVCVEPGEAPADDRYFPLVWSLDESRTAPAG